MRCSTAIALFLPLMALAACDGREESALDNLANGANVVAVQNSFKAEAQAVLEPLEPPAPGTPGGLPVTTAPVVEGTIDPKSAQGAAQVVQGYYGLLEEKRFAEAQDLWSESGTIGGQDDATFAARFRGFSEIHANVGAPGESDGAAGSIFITVPVQVYARVAATGKPWYMLRQVILRRVNDVDGSSEADRRWHIQSIGVYVPPVQGSAAANAAGPVAGQMAVAKTGAPISATDGMVRKPSP